MYKWVKTPLQFASVFCLLISLHACKDAVIKDKSGIGDGDLNLSYVDTFTVYSKTKTESTFPCRLITIGNVGSMNDPYFGKTYAGFFAQLSLTTNFIQFSHHPVLDSCVLSLPYYGHYGKCSVPTDVIVYQLSQSMDPAQIYNTSDAFTVMNPAIGTKYNHVPNFTDSASEYGKKVSPQLRIRLNNSFGNSILWADSSNFLSLELFRSILQGIYVTTNSSTLSDGINYIDLYNSRLTLYYHSDTDDSLQVDFPITSSSATINHFDHNYTSSPVQTALNSAAVSDQQFYVQAGSGVYTTLEFPSLKNFSNDTIAIVKAELIVPQFYDPSATDTIYSPIEYLSIRSLIDTVENALSIFDKDGFATNTTETFNGLTYKYKKFDITQFVQQLVNNNGNNVNFKHFALTGRYQGSLHSKRFVGANNPNDPYQKIKLKISYTKLK